MSTRSEALAAFLGGRVRVVVGDLTAADVDAIVNAAHSSLLGGGGVDGAIHRAGGPAILEACRAIRRTRYPDGLPTGEAVITTGGLMRARHVIHTVGPIYGTTGGRDADLLGACYRNAIALAAAEGLRSVAFPSISTGAYGYPKDEAAAVASRVIAEALAGSPQVSDVRLVFFSPSDARLFIEHQRFPDDAVRKGT